MTSLFLDILFEVPPKSEVGIFTRQVYIYLNLKNKLWAGGNRLGSYSTCV